MKISEVPEIFKIYTITMTNKSEYYVDGEQKKKIVDATTHWIDLPNGTSINKNYAIEMKLNMEMTRENVQKNKDSINSKLICSIK